MPKQILEFRALQPVQSKAAQVFCFVANAGDVRRIARIERAGRDEGGTLVGFQRPQIAGHIHEIRDYLDRPNAILPNSIILGFTSDAKLSPSKGGVAKLTIDITKGAPGWVVDGQQRFTALSEIGNDKFQVLVSGFICPTIEELQKQFILINNTRPLPKALVYELLPRVGDLPARMSGRVQASLLTDALNYSHGSSLAGLIKQHTNPKGMIADTVLQRLIMNSITDGALQLYASDTGLLLSHGFDLVSEFFHAVQYVFKDAWEGHTPKTSRLVHGTGLVAMGFVMDELAHRGAKTRTHFVDALRPLVGHAAWTGGKWFLAGEVRNWNSLQNVPQDVRALSLYLSGQLKKAARESSSEKNKSRRVRS